MLASHQAQAQPIAAPLLATVTAAAPIYIEAKVTQTPLRTAAVGTRLEVLEEAGAWVRVQFNDPQFGRRVGGSPPSV